MVDYDQDKALHVNNHLHENFVSLGYSEIHDKELEENKETILNHDHHSLQDTQIFDAPIYDDYYDFDDDLHEKQVVFSSSENSDQHGYDENMLTSIFDQQHQFSFHPFSITKSHT